MKSIKKLDFYLLNIPRENRGDTNTNNLRPNIGFVPENGSINIQYQLPDYSINFNCLSVITRYYFLRETD